MRILAPGDAPSWATLLARNIEFAIREPADSSIRLKGLLTVNLPPASDHLHGVFYDITAAAPKISNGSDWTIIPLAAGNNVWSGRQDVASHIRSTGSGVGGLTGAGVEFYFASDAGQILAYNRTTAVYKDLNLQGVIINIKPGGATAATYSSTGLDMASGKTISVNGSQILTARQTGWGAPSGTATRTTFATTTVTLEQLAQRVKALIDDLRIHGLINN